MYARTVRITIGVFLVSGLIASTAQAGETCATESTLTSDLGVVVQNAPIEPSAPYTLPTGNLDAATLNEAVDHVAAGTGSFFELLGLFADGQSRSVSGDVFKDLLASRGVDLSVLPMDLLQQVSSGDGYVDLAFDFGNRGKKSFNIPKKDIKVLEVEDPGSPYSADGLNNVVDTTVGGQTLVVKDNVRIFIEDGQVVSIREGDVKGKLLFLRANVDMQSTFEAGRVATDGEYRPVLQTDENGEPLIVDGHYVPETYDDWLIIEAAGSKSYMGVPRLKAPATEEPPVSS